MNSPGQRLPRRFFQRNALILARELLGCALVHDAPEGRTSGVIVETEAYRGPADKAAHSFRARRTARTEAMYGPAGHAYIYLIYGIHECLNVVAGDVGLPEAVLLRALQPVDGLVLQAKRRGVDLEQRRALRQLCSGPGKLTRAMGISRADHYGIDLCGTRLYIVRGQAVRSEEVVATPRVNVDYAEEWRGLPWRFIIRDSPYLSIPWRAHRPVEKE